MLFENALSLELAGFIDQYFGDMVYSVFAHQGHEPDLLAGPFSELPVVGISFIKDQLTVGRQLQVIQESLIMLLGCSDADKLCHAAKGIHQRMHFDAALFSGAIQPVAANPLQDLTEQLDRRTVNDL